MPPVLVLRLALRGVSGFWLLRQVTSTRKRFSPGMRWTIWRRKQGEWPGPPWKGDPRCSQSPPAFRAAMQVTKGVSSVPSQPAAFFPSPRVAPPPGELQLPLNQCQRVFIMSHACHGDGGGAIFVLLWIRVPQHYSTDSRCGSPWPCYYKQKTRIGGVCAKRVFSY